MQHATAETVARIEPLLKRIRKLGGLKERKPGIYYYKSSAFLHFHEDGDLVYADVKLEPPEFARLPVTTRQQQDDLIKAIKKSHGLGLK